MDNVLPCLESPSCTFEVEDYEEEYSEGEDDSDDEEEGGFQISNAMAIFGLVSTAVGTFVALK